MLQSGDITIRAAGPDDVAGVLQCLSTAFAPYCDQYTPGAYADTVLDLSTIMKRMEQMRVLVAFKSGSNEVVGTIAFRAEPGETEGHIRGMAVLPGVQGTGTAAKLLELAEESLRKEGCTHITLDTTEPLERAIRFYESHGYRPTGTIQDFYGMRLIEYEKQLARAS